MCGGCAGLVPRAAAPCTRSQVSGTGRSSQEHRGPEPDLSMGSGQQRHCWALCACPFLARLGMTPLRLLTNKQPCLRFGMVEPHRNTGAGGVLQGLGLRGQQLHPSCAGRAAAVGADECVPWAQRGPELRAACRRWSEGPALRQHRQWESPCSREPAKWIWQEQRSSMPKCAKLNQLCSADLFFCMSCQIKGRFGS